MEQYKRLVSKVLEEGHPRRDRTGVGTISLFGAQERYDLRGGYPLVTIKKSMFKSIVKELLWFLRGETNINTLGCGIWDEWADESGELGPVYGAQWRKWEAISELPEGTYHGPNDVYQDLSGTYEIDQIADLVTNLKKNPLSRRHIVTAWNPAEIDQMALPPCHTMFQLYASEIDQSTRWSMMPPLEEDLPVMGAVDGDFDVAEDETFVTYSTHGLCDMQNVPRYYLDLQLYQRSADLALGVPFNIASYSLLLMLLAKECNMVPRFFIHTIGDAHIYENHLEGVKEMLAREPLTPPTVLIADKPMPYPGCSRDGSVLEPDDFKLEGYKYHDRIKFPIAV